ncbi:formamidase [Fusarium albosuccineum]|uniref:Formamidase n=1 Tax=Fusarium albosuccineum TaxID=1237068 RepID=A0A8H4PGP9_9HYPO|nr:formamidase [Fusarium albosuccineum]
MSRKIRTAQSVSFDKPASEQPYLHNRWHPEDSADDVRDVDLTKIHYLTGPFDIQGSEPGDLLVVNITDVQPFDHSPWGFTGVFAKSNGGGFLDEHYPDAAKAIWDFDGIYATSRHIPGVRFAGLIHPGILGCAPSAEILAEWNRREADLVSTMGRSDPRKVLAQPPNKQNAHAGQATGDVQARIAREGARTIPGRPEHGGNCDINNISRGSTTYLPVHVAGAKFSVGDLHFSQGDGEISFCGAIEMAGIITIKFDLIKGGMKSRGLKSPVFKPGDMGPSYGPSRYLIFEGFSVDEKGKQHFMDATVAYRQACLRAIEYLKQFGYSGEQIYLLLSSAPVKGTIAGIVDIPNVCTTLGIPMDIFDFDISIENEPVKRDLGACPVSK